VWVTGVDAERPPHRSLLDTSERARWDLIRTPTGRSHFLVGVALTRLAVAAELRMSPAAVVIDRWCPSCERPHGKPRLSGCDLHVSVTHSGGRVAVALTRAGDVGVDLEEIVPRPLGELTRHVLADGEVAREPGDFYTYWCRKESAVKATGDGLRVPLAEVVVGPADEPARLLSYRGSAVAAAMTDLEVGPGFAGAVTVLTNHPIVTLVSNGRDLMSG